MSHPMGPWAESATRRTDASRSLAEAAQQALRQWRMPADLKEARNLQWTLARRVRTEDGPTQWRWVLGLDSAFVEGGRRIVAGAVLWDAAQRTTVRRWVAVADVEFPYVPGFLSFRETPGYLRVMTQVDHPVDVLLVDGQGTAHPRGFGIACHIGVLLDWPSVGVGKSRLFGRHEAPALNAGQWVPLWHPRTGAVIGAVLTTRPRTRPVYVSPGHRVSLERAVAIVLDCCDGYRLPEPQRQADQWVKRMRKQVWTIDHGP
ncbi:Endonuclease V [bacterium HR11]|nr:Endonuclease V [bacterium HR11]